MLHRARLLVPTNYRLPNIYHMPNGDYVPPLLEGVELHSRIAQHREQLPPSEQNDLTRETNNSMWLRLF
jgi:hypothetical protein